MGIFSDFINTLKSSSKNLKWFFVCVFMNGFIMSALSVMLGIYYKNLGMSEATIGTLLSVRTFGSSIGALFAIVLVESLGTKKALFISFSAMILSGFAFVNITVMPIMQATSLIFGIAQAIFTVVQAPFYKKNSDEKSVVGVFSAGFVLMNIAMFSGSFLFGKMSDFFAGFGGEVFGSKTVLNIGFGIMVIALFAIHQINFDGEIIKKEKNKLDLKSYFSIFTKDTGLYMLKMALIGMGAGLVIPFFSVYIKFSLGVSDSVVGSIMAFSQFGTVLGGLLVPTLSRKIGRVKLVLICQAISIPFLYSISFPQGVYMMAFSFFCRNTFMNMANPVLQSMAMDLVDEKHRTVMSSMFSLTDSLFRATGTQLGGILMVAVSYNFPYYITMFLYFLSTLVIYFVFGRNEKYKYLR